MTAEIAILNRSAVALAADSAVTISTPSGPKIYDSVNKLFALVKQRPVGIMIYDSADLLGVPWETIIKAYRMQRSGASPFDHLEQYADDFLQFIEGDSALIPRDLHDRYFDEAVHRRLELLRDRVNSAVEAALRSGDKPSQKRLRSFIDDAIVAEEEAWSSSTPGLWAASLDMKSLDQRYRVRVEQLMSSVLQKLPLIARQTARIKLLLLDSMSKIPYWRPTHGPVDPRSGIVIAGFGEQEYFPRLLSFEINGIVDGKLRGVPRENDTISADNTAIIAPFAQREMVDAFVSGINPQLYLAIGGYLRGLEGTFPDAVLQLLQQQMSDLDPATASALRGPLSSLVLLTVRELEDHMNLMRNDQVTPILNSVMYLPKDELAAMAESLVNLTSLKRRVSIDDPQTVGGPVDVAVISRGDGFVWIKRKHYFTQDLNPSWASTHAQA